MIVIEGRNVNEVYNAALWRMAVEGKEYKTRNGPAMRARSPVCTVYRHPEERVLFDAKRDANPFFHLMESIWMMAGRQDLDFVAKFASNMREYSDDGVILRGAYGYRWRHWFGENQIDFVVGELMESPDSRRAVISMWDVQQDIQAVMTGAKDVPCNTSIYFTLRDGRLDMTVTNRSNDIIWGCYGANAVHMSFLQEHVARRIGVPMGKYYQISNDWHIYQTHYPLMENRLVDYVDHYPTVNTVPFDVTMDECNLFCNYVMTFNNKAPKGEFFETVALPAFWAWKNHKDGHKNTALEEARVIKDGAWEIACTEWLTRRYEK